MSYPIIRTLHYATPFTVFLYYVVASIYSISTLRPILSTVRRSIKISILSISVGVLLGYVIDSILSVTQIFSTPGGGAQRDRNIFTLSQALIWIVLTATMYESDKHRWYPYWGAWTLTLVSEITTGVLGLYHARPRVPLAWAQSLVQLLRILAIVVLIAVIFAHRGSSLEDSVEETTPLLEDTQVPKPRIKSRLGFGLTETEEEIINALADEETAKRAKERAEKHSTVKARLEEEGSWLSYLWRFKIFAPYIWPSRNPALFFDMVMVGILLLAERALMILSPRQLGLVVNSLGSKDPAAFVQLCIYILLRWLNSYSGLGGFRQRFWLPIETYARVRLKTASYDRIMDLSSNFHDEKQSGELYTAMAQGNSLVNLLDVVLLEFLPTLTDLSLSLFYFYILFDSYLVLIGAATMIFYFWASIYIAGLQIAVQRKENASIRRRYQVLYSTMGDWKTVSYFSRIPHCKKLYESSVSFSQKLWTQLRLLMILGYTLSQSVLDCGALSAFLFGAYHVVYGQKDVGAFVTLVSYWNSFTMPITMLARVHKEVLEYLVDAEELLTLFRKEPEIQDGSGELQVSQARVTFDKVSFNYAARSRVLKDISFEVEPGKTVALVGQTGAGKSTILKLLFRFYDVSQGSIQIDGQDIRGVTLSSLREAIGVVPQDATLFNDTIFANLRFSRLDATDEEIYESCKAAAIHDKILTFPDGYYSKVGEKGVKLSGGEIQRIAIARAILRDPKIILLDEATSSVDNDTEAKIQAALKTLCAGRTTFIVAHRLTTIMEADLVAVVHDGSIVEQGTPAELMKRKGRYYNLWSKQLDLIDAMKKSDEHSDTLIETTDEEDSSTESSRDDTSEGKPKATGSEIEIEDTADQTSKMRRKRFRSGAQDQLASNQTTYGALPSSGQGTSYEAPNSNAVVNRTPQSHSQTGSNLPATVDPASSHQDSVPYNQEQTEDEGMQPHPQDPLIDLESESDQPHELPGSTNAKDPNAKPDSSPTELGKDRKA